MAMQMNSMRKGLDIPSWTLPGTDIEIKPGDCVLIRPWDPTEAPYVAKVTAIRSDKDGRSNLRVRIRYYYRPEDTKRGIRSWNGADEVFLSLHFDVLSVATIECKCWVHTLEEYERLARIEYEDFFHRADYDAEKGKIDMRYVQVYHPLGDDIPRVSCHERKCICKELYNPDNPTVICDGCRGEFHPACVGMTIEEAENLAHFFCGDCSSK